LERRDFVKSLSLLGGGLFMGFGRAVASQEQPFEDKTLELGEYIEEAQDTFALPPLLEPDEAYVPKLVDTPSPPSYSFNVAGIFDIDWSKELDEHLDPSFHVCATKNTMQAGDIVNMFKQPEIHIKKLDSRMRVQPLEIIRKELEHFYLAIHIQDEYLDGPHMQVFKMHFDQCMWVMAKELQKCNGIYAAPLPCNAIFPEIRQKLYTAGRVPVRVTATYLIDRAATAFYFDVLAADMEGLKL
jgi:hypothetical protein